MKRAPPSSGPESPESVEEDSKVFYGRVSLPADGSPKKIQISEVSTRTKTRPNHRVTVPPTRRRKGPPTALVAIAVLAFLAVAVMIAMKAMKG